MFALFSGLVRFWRFIAFVIEALRYSTGLAVSFSVMPALSTQYVAEIESFGVIHMWSL